MCQSLVKWLFLAQLFQKNSASLRLCGEKIILESCLLNKHDLNYNLINSLILTGRLCSILVCAAIPVKQDIAPARESGNFKMSGTCAFLKITSRKRKIFVLFSCFSCMRVGKYFYPNLSTTFKNNFCHCRGLGEHKFEGLFFL